MHPENDPWGNPWPTESDSYQKASTLIANGEYVGIIWAISSDAEYAANELKLPHFGRADQMCPWCPASRGHYNFRDVSDAAPWLPDVYVIGREPALPRHPIWELSASTRWLYTPDIMHNCHLGTDLYLIGGCIEDLTCADGPFDGTEKQRFDSLWATVQDKLLRVGG